MKYSTLLSYITPHRDSLALIVCLLLTSSAVSLANPWMAGLLTQSILDSPADASGFQVILMVWMLLILVRSLLGFATTYMVGSTGATMAARFRSRVYEHMQIQPLTYFQERKQGDLLTLLSNDSEMISNFVTSTMVQLLPLLLTFVGALLIMAWMDSTIALLAVMLMPFYYLATKLIGRKIRPITAQWIESWSSMFTLAQENLSLIPAIKAFTRESLESRRFAARNSELLQLTKRQILIQSAMTPAIGFLAGAGLLLLLWVGIEHVQAGQLATPDLVSLLLYAMLLTQPVSGLANVYGQVMRTRGAAERLLKFFEEQPEPFQAGMPNFGKIKGEIEFRNISFSYAGREKVIDHYNLKINAGETVALTGPNGAGKTTLVHLLMRFVDPSEGQILIDGINIHARDISSLRDQIGLVAQNTLLLNGTVMENISYGIPAASFEDIKKAARAARADDFITRLPNGYETVIGDQGIKLSGGQRQRLSLARSLLKNPPILILDEATSMFDPEGEAGFFEECEDFLKQRTVIFITHRSTTLKLANKVVTLRTREGI